MFSLNVGLERDKAKMSLQLTRSELTPGEPICGVLSVLVQKAMKITAVRLEVRAKEQCDFKVKGSSRVVKEFVHFKQEITFFGFSSMSGRKGGAELDAGSYQYPFQVLVPSTAPPSYFFKGSAGTAELDWKVKAFIVIPNSPFDAKEEKCVTVLSAIGRRQFDELNTTPYAAGTARGAIPASSSCCGGSPGELDVAITTFPRAVLMQRQRTTTSDAAAPMSAGAAPLGYQMYTAEATPYGKKQPDLVFEEPPSYVTESPPGRAAGSSVPNVLAVPPNSGFSDNDNAVTVRVKLTASKADAKIKKVRVNLHQWVQVSGNGSSFCDLQRIAGIDIVPPDSRVRKGSSVELDAHLQLGDQLRTDRAVSNKAPLPSMATAMFESSFIATVSFPDSVVADEMTVSNVAYIFGVFDMSNRVPQVPTRYVTSDIQPEQVISGM